jgi:hypothetical protein
MPSDKRARLVQELLRGVEASAFDHVAEIASRLYVAHARVDPRAVALTVIVQYYKHPGPLREICGCARAARRESRAARLLRRAPPRVLRAHAARPARRRPRPSPRSARARGLQAAAAPEGRGGHPRGLVD